MRSGRPRLASRRCCRCSAIPCRRGSRPPRCATSTPPASSRCSQTSPRAVTPDGLELDVPASFLIGAAATPGRTTLENLAGKIDAGAAFVQTQIVLDVDAFAAWLEPFRDAGLCDRVAILPGVVIPRSAAMVERMAGFGALVADGVAERAEQGDGLALACELAERLLALPGVAGLHLMPLGVSPEAMSELAAHARRAHAQS